ncbi:hypothetical protein CL630_00545 [bacterium]|nr:hypothetical protein [bacterium]|tara:strand:- start:966 stop:1313 length:348 start_codon:yes stop_codon:yes gene_type:complete
MSAESFKQIDPSVEDAETEFESAIKEAGSLEELAELIGGNETLPKEKRNSSLQAIKVLLRMEPEDRGNYLTSPGCAALREQFLLGLQDKLAELIGPAKQREAHNFGSSDRSVDHR